MPGLARTIPAVDGLHLRVTHYPAVAGPDPAVPAPRAGVPTLLVHGFASAGAGNWERTGWVRTLTRAGIDLLTVDLRGHGGSDRPSDPGCYRLDLLVADALTAAESALAGSAGRIDLVGYSLGARVVSELAAGPLAGRVHRVALGGYAGGPLLQGLDPTAVATAFERWELSDEGERGWLAGHDPAVARLLEIAAAVPGNDPAALGALVVGLAGDPALAEPAPTPHGQVLLFWGADDPYAAGAARWAASMPAARTLVIPARDHISVLTSGPLRDAVAGFLAAG